jgi:pimeloyl-ACP methyl ester carboxylesterase
MSTTEIRLPGLVALEHTFEIPLDHSAPDGAKIEVFARELAGPEGREKPFLVYLQGGPGSEATRPTRLPNSPGWLDQALKDFRVLMLDQRGTGRSTPVGELEGMSPAEQAEYLSWFRADSIVRDAEWIRRTLGVERWSVLGQSFGGFCATTYLSIAPEGLREALITGGLPPLGNRVDEVFTRTYARMRDRNRRYYDRYPSDRRRVLDLQRRFASDAVRLPTGDHLTGRRLRQLGQLLGFSDGPERLHYLLELPVNSPAFRHDIEHAVGFARNPIYAILHEACWADGGTTRWSADRVMPDEFRRSAELFFGEHIFPWMFDDYGALKSLREAADLLAAREWPRLYDQDVLAANEVSVAALVYADDPYVERGFSEETAAHIRGARVWLTNEYEHNGLGADGERVFGRLLDLARGRM